jgi:leucyl aminopeptidase (aminopeptidase T)
MKEPMAQIAVNKCLRIKSSDNVVVFFNPHFTKLAEDIAIECFKNGADVLLNAWTDRYQLGQLTHLSEESLRQPSVWCRELTRNSTAEFFVGGVIDPAIYRKMTPEKMAASEEGENAAHFPLARERKVRTLGLALGLVTKPRAKAYRFNFRAWEKTITAASNVNPEGLAKKATEIANKLRSAEKVKVISPSGTNIEFSVKGRKLRINDGIVDERDMTEDVLDASLPAGSLNTTIVEESANGKVVLDVPTAWAGRTIRRMEWVFENGKLTSFKGDKNALELRTQWEKAAGDKDRIATLTIGVNPKAKPGYLENEIVEGAVGIGIGGNEDIGGNNKRGFNFSGTISKATLTLDGTTLIDRGKIVV